MIRGTTQVYNIKFLTKIDLSKVRQVYITFASQLHEVTKDIRDVKIEPQENRIVCYLTQQDTLSFQAGEIKMQVRILLSDGSAHASRAKSIRVEKILRDGEIFVNEVY